MRRLRVKEDVSFALGWSRVTVRPHYGGLPLARLDVVRAKAEKSVGWLPVWECPVPGRTVLRLEQRRGGAP